MRIHSETQILLTRPIFQVVLRFETRARKIGNFILLDSVGIQPITGDLVHVSGEVFVRNEMRVILLSSRDELSA